MNKNADVAEVRGFDDYPLRLGDVMRGERATLGKSLLDVQRDLRIKATYIAAIENCDSTVFQTPGFIAGYVRSYARYLRLDPEATFAQFCAEANFDGVHPPARGRTRPAPVAAPRPEAVGRPAARDPLVGARIRLSPSGAGVLDNLSLSGLGSILILAVLILGIGYGAWAVLQDIQRVEFAPVEDSSVVAAAPAPVAIDGGNTLASLPPERLYRPLELDVPVMTPRDGPIAALDPDQVGALIPGNGDVMPAEIRDGIDDNSPVVTADTAPEIAIIARSPAWVRVSASDGAVLFEKILDGGESFVLPRNMAAANLRAGNSGSVYVSIDGVIHGPVGKDTSVVRNVALDAGQIADRFAEVSEPEILKAMAEPRVITLNADAN
jgi:cytoskeleton protein RodZ